ncbi:sensor histidine kinase [Jeotgalibaca ciconiae]|nr:GHKL domain-containing protein [Jeotgalibaca ciconiae]HJB23998.1 GHKL domain-containing protein [Candidatus Jeotgalibaca pullicola]
MTRTELILFVVLTIIVLAGITLYFLQKRYQKNLVFTQTEMLQQHAEEVENVYRHMRGWRHDYKNHIQSMKAYLELNQLDLLENYLEELDEDLVAIDMSIRTGNVMADAILNSKLSLAEARGIRLNVKAEIPSDLAVQNVDLGVLIGNLLSNAIEGSLTVEDSSERFIRVYITVMKQQLYISVTNSMNQKIKKTVSGYLTTKTGKEHGFGLKRIDQTAEKYNGYVNRQHEEGVFATEVLLPL